MLAGTCPSVWEGCPRIVQFLKRQRRVTPELTEAERNTKLWEAAGDHAAEAIVNSEEEIRKGLDGIPVPFALFTSPQDSREIMVC
jgi:hypothetical protein